MTKWPQPVLLPILVMLGVGLTGCNGVPSSTIDKESSYADHNLGGTLLGKLATDVSAGREDSESGFLLLDRGHEALAWRLWMAALAQRTIDAQYFLWKDDRAGRMFIHALLDAADRGVRVRVMIDDSMTESDPQYLARFGRTPTFRCACTNRLARPTTPLCFAGSISRRTSGCSIGGCTTSCILRTTAS